MTTVNALKRLEKRADIIVVLHSQGVRVMGGAVHGTLRPFSHHHMEHTVFYPYALTDLVPGSAGAAITVAGRGIWPRAQKTREFPRDDRIHSGQSQGIKHVQREALAQRVHFPVKPAR